MSRTLKQKRVWVSEVRCCSCGAKETFSHYGKNKKDAIRDWPSESINGWKVSKMGKELCPTCRYQ